MSYPQISTRRSDDKASRPFITYTLNAPANPILIQQYAEENIKPVLGQLKGIYKVELNGATPMEWQLEYDSDQLSHLGITLQAVQRAINRHYEKEFLGICSIEKGAEAESGSDWYVHLLKKKWNLNREPFNCKPKMERWLRWIN